MGGGGGIRGNGGCDDDARIEESFASLADLAHSPPERRALSRSVASLRIREGGFELAAFSATRTALFLAAYVKSRPHLIQNWHHCVPSNITISDDECNMYGECDREDCLGWLREFCPKLLPCGCA